jgi:DNA-binding MarR family transcriptional regulator
MPDAEDRRSVRAEITAEGRHAYALGQRVVQDFEQQLLEDYSMEERLALSRLLTRLSGGEGR